MAFDPDAYLAKKAPVEPGRSPGQFSVSELPKDNGGVPEFNPDAYLQTKSAPQEQRQGDRMDMDSAQTQLESFGNAVSLGYLPQIQAAFESINPDPSGGVDEQLRAQGFNVPSQGYVDLRDENIKRQEAQTQRNPYASAAGMVGGMAVTAPVISSGAALLNGGKAALSGFARLKDSARLGAALGLVSNPGDTEGVIAPLQAMDRLKNSGTGGALGAAGQIAGDSIAKTGEVIRKAPETLSKLSKNAAFQSTGAMLKDFRAAFGRNSTEEIGETLLKKNIVAAGDTFDDIANKSQVAKEETGKFIGDTYKKVEDIISNAKTSGGLSRADALRLKASELDGKKIADAASGVIKRNGQGKLGGSKIISSVQDKLDDLASRKNVTMKDLLEFKSGLDGDINYSKQMKELPEVQQQLKGFRDVINKKIQDRVRVAGKIVKDDNLIEGLKQANKEYGHLSTAQRTASDRINRESANKYFGLTAHIDGAAGGIIGAATGDSIEDKVKNGLIGLVVGKAANKSSKYALPIASRTAKNLGEALQKPAAFAKYGQPIIEAAKRSPQEFQALLNQLGKDPEFLKLAKPQGVN